MKETNGADHMMENERQTHPLSWGHININVSNLEQAAAFYERLGFARYRTGIPYLNLTDAPGFSEIPDSAAQALRLAPGTRARACILELGGGFPKLDLIEFETQPDARPPGNQQLGPVRLCLATRDVQAAYDRLSADGVQFLSPPQPCQDRMAHIALCQDPDGTLIELIQVHPDKWPVPS